MYAIDISPPQPRRRFYYNEDEGGGYATGVVSAAVCLLFVLLILFSASYLPYSDNNSNIQASESVQRYWWRKPGGRC